MFFNFGGNYSGPDRLPGVDVDKTKMEKLLKKKEYEYVGWYDDIYFMNLYFRLVFYTIPSLDWEFPISSKVYQSRSVTELAGIPPTTTAT